MAASESSERSDGSIALSLALHSQSSLSVSLLTTPYVWHILGYVNFQIHTLFGQLTYVKWPKRYVNRGYSSLFPHADVRRCRHIAHLIGINSGYRSRILTSAPHVRELRRLHMSSDRKLTYVNCRINIVIYEMLKPVSMHIESGHNDVEINIPKPTMFF